MSRTCLLGVQWAAEWLLIPLRLTTWPLIKDTNLSSEVSTLWEPDFPVKYLPEFEPLVSQIPPQLNKIFPLTLYSNKLLTDYHKTGSCGNLNLRNLSIFFSKLFQYIPLKFFFIIDFKDMATNFNQILFLVIVTVKHEGSFSSQIQLFFGKKSYQFFFSRYQRTRWNRTSRLRHQNGDRKGGSGSFGRNSYQFHGRLDPMECHL